LQTRKDFSFGMSNTEVHHPDSASRQKLRDTQPHTHSSTHTHKEADDEHKQQKTKKDDGDENKRDDTVALKDAAVEALSAKALQGQNIPGKTAEVEKHEKARQDQQESKEKKKDDQQKEEQKEQDKGI
jgi:hypothetical protein